VPVDRFDDERRGRDACVDGFAGGSDFVVDVYGRDSFGGRGGARVGDDLSRVKA
jgi:hypothetical protein